MVGKGLAHQARRDFILHQAARYQRQAHAGHHRADHGLELVELRPGQRVDEGLHPVRLAPAQPCFRHRHVAHQCVVGHIAWRVDGPVGHAGARGDQGHLIARDVVRVCAGPVAFTEQNGAVQLGPLEVVAVHVGHEVQRDLRVQLLELRQARDEPLGRKRGQTGQV
ncbi:hypothetical protein D3C71_1223290 [compost metagenome]